MIDQQILIEKFKNELLECLDETFEWHHGIYIDKGTSLLETLESFDAREASASIAGGGATVAAHVEHAGLYLDVLERSMRGETVGKVDWREIWERVGVVSPEEWNERKQKLRESYRRIVKTIESSEGWENDDGFGAALGVLAHTAYHLGAIRQIATAIKSAKK